MAGTGKRTSMANALNMTLIRKAQKMTLLQSDIEDALARIIAELCNHPAWCVSEGDMQFHITRKLMELPQLAKPVKTACTIGASVSKKGKAEKTYETFLVHREYGHQNKEYARSDIVILEEDLVASIDDPIDLKINGQWIPPNFIIEIGTEKSAGSACNFERHLTNDIEKTLVSDKKGYVIHIQRNLLHSKGERGKLNRAKYVEYAEVIKRVTQSIAPDKPAKIRIVVALVSVGNEGRRISREGKTKLYINGQFKGVPQESIQTEVRAILQ